MAGNFDLVLEDFPKIEIREDRPCVFFSSNLSRYYLYLHTLLARKLWEAESIPSVFLDKTDDLHQYFPRQEHNDLPLNNCLIKNNYCFDCDVEGYDDGVDLQVDLEAQEILYDGLNLYDVLSASLARDKCQYEVDLTDPSLKREVERGIKSIRQVLMLAETIKEFAEQQVQKVIIIGNDPNYIPNGVFFRWTRFFQMEGKVEFIHLAAAYMHYFGYTRKDWVLGKNLTTKGLLNRMQLTPEDFSEHQKTATNPQYRINEAKNLLNLALDSRDEDFGEVKNIPENIRRWKCDNKPLIGLFPNLFYDRPLKDETHLFSGLKDWILKTVEEFRKIDAYLLIKPHPSEAFPRGTGGHPSETVKDLFTENSLPENVLLLEPDQLPSKEVIPLLDLGLVWRSSIALEMGLMDVPVIVCGPVHWQEHINFPSPETMEGYQRMICEMPSSNPIGSLKRKIADYITYLHESPVRFSSFDAEKDQWDQSELSKSMNEDRPEILEMILKEIQ